jgi:hypothetical protein
MSKTMHALIAARAKEEGVSLNLFVVEAAAEAAGRYEGPSRIGTRRHKLDESTKRGKLRKSVARKAPVRGKRAKQVA